MTHYRNLFATQLQGEMDLVIILSCNIGFMDLVDHPQLLNWFQAILGFSRGTTFSSIVSIL